MDGTTNKPKVKFIEQEKKPLSGLGLAGTILGGGAAALAIGNMMGNVATRYLGPNSPLVTGNNPAIAPAIQAAIPPVVNALTVAANEGGYVTKENLNYVREIAAKDAEIAELKAKENTAKAVKEAVSELTNKYDAAISALNNRACNLETHAAVTAAGFEDYKQFANRIYVHQPKAYMRERIVSCEDSCGCCCNDHDRHRHNAC